MTAPHQDWFDDADLVRQLPRRIRCLAAYCRVAVRRAEQRVPGGSFIHRQLARATRFMGLSDTAAVRVGERVTFVDLLDPDVHAVACSDRHGTTEIFIPGTGSGSASVVRGAVAGPAATVNVRLVPFDDLVDWKAFPGRVVIKLDVEGSELGFLRGAERMIRASHPVIVMELNPTTLAAAGHDATAWRTTLRDLGYDLVSEIDTYPAAVPLDELETHPQRNVVVIPNDAY